MRKLLLQTLLKAPLTESRPADDDPEFVALSRQLKQGIDRRFGRSLAIRQVDAGSCNGCELEIHALNNPFYDLERFGLKFVASPRHADLLLVTGPVSFNMREALQRTYDATPEPIAMPRPSVKPPACAGGISDVIPVDLHIPGCPPTPISLIKGLLALVAKSRA